VSLLWLWCHLLCNEDNDSLNSRHGPINHGLATPRYR